MTNRSFAEHFLRLGEKSCGRRKGKGGDTRAETAVGEARCGASRGHSTGVSVKLGKVLLRTLRELRVARNREHGAEMTRYITDSFSCEQVEEKWAGLAAMASVICSS